MSYTQLYQASSATSDDTRYVQISRFISSATCTFLIIYIQFLLNKYPATYFICKYFEIKRCIENQKVKVADEIKRDICLYLVSSDVANDIWYNEVP